MPVSAGPAATPPAHAPFLARYRARARRGHWLLLALAAGALAGLGAWLL